MTETYVNTRDGRLYIGEAALDGILGQPDMNLVPLWQVAAGDETELPPPYSGEYAKDWSLDECTVYGEWILNVLSEACAEQLAERQQISSPMLDRLSRLGLGPSADHITERFGSLPAYAEAIGATNVRKSDRFREWTLEDLAAYASKVAKEVGGKPGGGDYLERYRQLRGPHPDFIARRAGGIGRLNELIGYPDIPRWDEDDFIDWGVKVTLANEGLKFGTRLVGHLSRLQRGPSEFSIRARFGTLSKFQQIVAEAAETQLDEEAERDAVLMDEYRGLAEAGLLNLPADMSERERLRVTAQFLVVRRCAPGIDGELAAAMARQTVGRCMGWLLKKNEDLTAGFVETTAVSLGVFDYMWPMDEWRRYLRVDYSALGYERPPSRYVYLPVARAAEA